MKGEFKRKLIATLVLPALGLSVAIAADRSDKAADTQSSGSQHQAAAKGDNAPRTAAQDVRASTLMGMTVKNAQGETLGKIDDLVVDVNNERIYYAVLASGGVMGLGGKLFAYPVSLFRPGADKDELALNVDKERLKNAPSFDKKSWPEWGGSGERDKYRADVDKYFGPTVTAKSLPNERLVRASELLGKNVDDREGKKAAEIKDLVVNLGTGRVRYAVLDVDSSWMKSDKLMPVALKSFSYPAERDSKKGLVLNVARNQLDNSQGIEKKRWSELDINDPAFKRDMDNQLAAGPSTRSGAAGQAGSRHAADRDSSRDASGKSSSDRE